MVELKLKINCRILLTAVNLQRSEKISKKSTESVKGYSLLIK